MAWTELTRARYMRKTERYPSDLTAQEWAVVCPLLPGPNHLGRPRQVELRRIWNAVQYIAAAGCAWSRHAEGLPAGIARRYRRCAIISTVGATMACLPRLLDKQRGLIAALRTHDEDRAAALIAQHVRGAGRHITDRMRSEQSSPV